jgi:hypothetical protein
MAACHQFAHLPMPAQIRIPYYRLDFAGFFALQRAWKLFDKAEGCKPLKNPQAAILMERKPPPLPGEKPPEAKKAAPPKPDTKGAANGAEAKKVAPHPSSIAGANNEKAAQPLKVSNDQVKSNQAVEECKAPPPFDMLDLPDAMEHMGFTVASKLSKRWFNGRKHEIPNDPQYIYPDDMVDTKIVSLDFVLKYPKARAKYEHLTSSGIYNDRAIKVIREKVGALLARKFIDNGIAYSGELDAFTHSGRDIQKLHNEFQFQREVVSNFDTLDWSCGLTDLTASLANFAFCAAVAEARVYTEKYYNYPKGAAPVYCCQSQVEVTHIYVYARDSYSFTDKPGKKASQYLGHWNRNGVILVPAAVAADLATNYGKDVQWGNGPYTEDGFDKPVDILKGMFGEMRKQDVYYPIRNSDYHKWREKFGRGGDFAIYTELKKVKLPKPIKLTLEEICKPKG